MSNMYTKFTSKPIPEYMKAVTIRDNRYGEPKESMKIERVEVPSQLDDYEVLIYVMAAGINYNVIWAGRGKPLDVLKNTQKLDNDPREYFIPGSDGAGIVCKVGKEVTNVKVGDEVILQSGYVGKEKHLNESNETHANIRAWGYEVNGGTFAEYTRVQSYQCIPKPKNLSWPEAACFMVSAATSYSMLCNWIPNVVQKDEPVLIWGGASGIGSMAIQIARYKGAKPVAVVSSKEKEEFCKSMGAVGVIYRNKFNKWGKMPDINDVDKFNQWRKHVKEFRFAFWEALGEKRNPKIVFEHPGQDTISTSLAVVEKEGMVVTCGGTSGYYGNFDLRQLWVYKKRIQGSHFASLEQCHEVTRLVANGLINPCLSKVFSFDDIILAHQMMAENRHPCGNMSVLIGCEK